MARTSRSLVPPPRRPNDGPPLPPELYTEPAEEILLVGEMLHDAQTMKELLAGLPFERDSYRANLRIIAGASTRMRQRCEKLLGEIDPGMHDPRPDLPATEFAAPAAAEAFSHSSVILEPGALDPQQDPETTAEPRNPGAEYAALRNRIRDELREHGPLSTADLIARLKAVPEPPTSSDINDALADLRLAKEVTIDRAGKKLKNRLIA